MITRRDWWLGVALVTAAILFHAAFPRFQIQQAVGQNQGVWRIDRWSGEVEITTDKATSWLKITESP